MANKKVKDNEAKSVWAKPYYGGIEYEMSKLMAKELLNERKGADRNIHPQEYLCKVVNASFGLKGYCTRVITI